MKSKNQNNILFAIVLTSFFVLTSIAFLAKPVRAAEIAPDSASYSYGSTSEVSPSSQIQISNSSSLSTLASTGENTIIILVGAIVLIGGGVVCLRFVVSKKRR